MKYYLEELDYPYGGVRQLNKLAENYLAQLEELDNAGAKWEATARLAVEELEEASNPVYQDTEDGTEEVEPDVDKEAILDLLNKGLREFQNNSSEAVGDGGGLMGITKKMGQLMDALSTLPDDPAIKRSTEEVLD